MTQNDSAIVSVLRVLHDALGVAEHFSPPAAKAEEEVAGEVIDALATEVKTEVKKEDGAD